MLAERYDNGTEKITTRSALWDACVTAWSKNFTNTTHSEAYTSGGKTFAHYALKHVKEILYGGLQLVKGISYPIMLLQKHRFRHFQCFEVNRGSCVCVS